MPEIHQVSLGGEAVAGPAAEAKVLPQTHEL